MPTNRVQRSVPGQPEQSMEYGETEVGLPLGRSSGTAGQKSGPSMEEIQVRQG